MILDEIKAACAEMEADEVRTFEADEDLTPKQIEKLFYTLNPDAGEISFNGIKMSAGKPKRFKYVSHEDRRVTVKRLPGGPVMFPD